MKVALCQLIPEIGDVSANTDSVIGTMESNDADLFIFPELFLTDYTFDDMTSVSDLMDESLERLLSFTRITGKTVVIGGPYIYGDSVFNSAYVISGNIKRYDKINLPDFGVFSERKIFSEGDEPLMFEKDGFIFGVIICYDVFFPELTKLYAMNGADAVICISASPMTSKPAFERVLPARSVEDTIYTIFVNNVSKRGDMEFFGKSRCLSPTGDVVAIMDHGPSVTTVELDHELIRYARIMRPTLADTRFWMINKTSH